MAAALATPGRVVDAAAAADATAASLRKVRRSTGLILVGREVCGPEVGPGYLTLRCCPTLRAVAEGSRFAEGCIPAWEGLGINCYYGRRNGMW